MFKAYFNAFVYAGLPVIIMFSKNIVQLTLYDALLVTFVLGFLSMLVLKITSWFYGDLQKSSLFVSLLFFLALSYGHFRIVGNQFGIREILGPQGSLIVWLLMLFAGMIFIHKQLVNTELITKFINIAAIVLLLISVGNISYYYATKRVIAGRGSSLTFEIPGPEDVDVSNVSTDSLPDIFYIILDGYARQDTLARLYNYDNSEMLNFLGSEGFYVASGSYANYMQTNLSLASSLNGIYLDKLASIESSSMGHSQQLLANNWVLKTLKRAGYRTVAFESGYDITELKKADKYITTSLVSRQFANLVLTSSILSAIPGSLFPLADLQAMEHARKINRLFSSIPHVKAESAPKFVFAHIGCPHLPCVFDENGAIIKQSGEFSIRDGSHANLSTEEYRRKYLGQLKYVNKKIVQMIRKMLESTDRKQVIILQSDHGPGSALDLESVQGSDLPERFAILNAVYFEDRDYTSLYPAISPVNTFRVIFNKYLAANLPLLDDKSYYSTWSRRYQFIDVSMSGYE